MRGVYDCRMDFPPSDYEAVLLLDVESGQMVIPFCYLAKTRRAARKGLLGRRELPETHGLLLSEGVVHMAGMRFPLDLVFLDRRYRVVKIAPHVRPGLRLRGSFKARHTLELTAGTTEKIKIFPGQQLRVRNGS